MFFSKQLVADTIATRVKNGFRIGDVLHDLGRIQDEVKEAIEAYTSKDTAAFADELADILIFLLTTADAANVNLEKAIIAKVKRNTTRVWKHT